MANFNLLSEQKTILKLEIYVFKDSIHIGQCVQEDLTANCNEFETFK
jgi:hypothetical protein